MLSVAVNGYQHVASCESNQVYQQHMDLSHQQTNPLSITGFCQERTEDQLLLQRPEMSGANGIHAEIPCHLS